MKIVVKAYDYVIKRSKIFANVLKYIINNLDVITILYRDFISKDQFNCI